MPDINETLKTSNLNLIKNMDDIVGSLGLTEFHSDNSYMNYSETTIKNYQFSNHKHGYLIHTESDKGLIYK